MKHHGRISSRLLSALCLSVVIGWIAVQALHVHTENCQVMAYDGPSVHGAYQCPVYLFTLTPFIPGHTTPRLIATPDYVTELLAPACTDIPGKQTGVPRPRSPPIWS